MGRPAQRDRVAGETWWTVERYPAVGLILCGRTNTPQFGNHCAARGRRCPDRPSTRKTLRFRRAPGYAERRCDVVAVQQLQDERDRHLGPMRTPATARPADRRSTGPRRSRPPRRSKVNATSMGTSKLPSEQRGAHTSTHRSAGLILRHPIPVHDLSNGVDDRTL